MKHHKIYVPKRRIKNMTICIASICNRVEDGYLPAIVFCADRLLSSSITFEHGNPKIKLIPERAIVMEAGDATISDLVLNKEILSDKNSKTDLKFIAEKINQNILNLRNRVIEEKVLSKFGIDYNTFLTAEIPQNLFNHIVNQIELVTNDLSLEFLLVGFDTDGSPQLFKISSETGIQCYNSVGFVNSGSGQFMSLIEMTKSEHSNSIPDSEAILKVYAAKKGAERVAGVGKNDDLGVLYTVIDEKENISKTVYLVFDHKFKQNLIKELREIKRSEDGLRKRIKSEIDEVLRPHEEKSEDKVQSDENE